MSARMPAMGSKRRYCKRAESDAPDPTWTCAMTVGSMEGLGRVERSDCDVIPVRISERKLHGSGVGIHMWLLFQSANESARPGQSHVKVVDPEEQEETVSRRGVVGARQ